MQSQKFNTRAVVEAGLISTIIALIMIVAGNLPVLSGITTIVLPIPIAILCVRHNYSVALGGVFTSGILIAIFYSPISALANAVMFGLVGIALGYCIKTKKSGWFSLVIIALSAAAAVAIDMGLLLTFVYKTGFVDFINQNIKLFKDSMEKAYEFYRQSGVSESQMQSFKEASNIITFDYVVQILPASLLLFSFTFSLFVIAFTNMILKRLNYGGIILQPYSMLYINNRIGTVLLIFVIIGALMNNSGLAAGGMIAGAFRIMAEFAFVIDGSALISYFLRNKLKLGKFATGIIIFLTVISPIFMIFYALAGLTDMILDIRKLDPLRTKKAH